MSEESERDAQWASGPDSMASCILTDADGNQVFVGDWVSEAKPSDSGDSEEVERRPRRKGSLREQWLRGETAAKSLDEGGIWRTIEGDQKIYINSKGEVRAGSPSGPAIGKVSGAKKPSTKPKEAPKPESDSEKPKPKPNPNPKPKPKPASEPKKPKQGIVDGSGKPIISPPFEDLTKAIDAAENTTKGWVKKLTKSEAGAVAAWSDTSYGPLRKEIANGKPSKEASDFLTALEKAPPIEAEVYRGLAFSETGLESFKKKLSAIGVGGTWEDSAPFSTSLEPVIAAGFMGGYKSGVMMRIKTKSGRYITPAAVSEEESEVVSMPRVKYKITAMETGRKVDVYMGFHAEPKLYVEMEEIE